MEMDKYESYIKYVKGLVMLQNIYDMHIYYKVHEKLITAAKILLTHLRKVMHISENIGT